MLARISWCIQIFCYYLGANLIISNLIFLSEIGILFFLISTWDFVGIFLKCFFVYWVNCLFYLIILIESPLDHNKTFERIFN